ncbi:putative cytochrome P450 4s3 [Lucilia cuprina]|uniref:Putative cytochrome P450 4s3 n=1 Tax=Lucilia cuprina TaxID=7375 RepID=A0A0L0BLU5_LUCCU|nr:putative cytochrome P450 4s3 [Lucilia cuprina]KNC20997.1 putative cytochrome P450 4s3 [Lucilia cuprina]
MNTLALIAFALWAVFMRYLPNIIAFIKMKKWSENVPGPTIGEFIENAKKGEILNWFIELRKKYGPTFRLWLGKDLMVFFTDPEDVKQLLSNNTLLYKSENYNILSPWLGKGLLTNGGESWHTRRKLLTPAFHFRILSEFKEPMEENCKILVSKLREKANGEQFDIYPYITLFALDAICETAMGIKKHAQMQSESEYVKAVQKICHILHKKSFSFWQRINIFFKFTKPGRERDDALKILHNETNRVIKLRRKLLEDSQIHNMNDAQKADNIEGQKRRLAFLDMLLISQMEGVPLSDREIREEVDTFMFEGHDTTSSAIGFAIYLLSQHADVQQQAYEEAIALEGREKEAMPYLEAVIKETLRLYPSVPFYSRRITEDLNVGSLIVPKDASISILTYMVHRDEKNFPDPEKFDPLRFLSKENNLHPFSFVAFSAGPRNCIGQKFAMLELKCSLSYLLRNFEFLPVKDFKPQPLAELVMKSGNGIQIKMKMR